MSETEATKPPSKGTRKRKLAYASGTLLCLLALAYFVVTSSTFFKHIVLPRIATSLNATVTVKSASVSPFSKITLTDLSLKTTGADPLLAAKRLHLEYNLWAILGGLTDIDMVALESPVIHVVRNADGTSNLDPLLASTSTDDDNKTTKGGTPQIDIDQVILSNARIRIVNVLEEGGQDIQEISGATVLLTDIRNGGTCSFSIAGHGALETVGQAEASRLGATVECLVKTRLSSELALTRMTGSIGLNITNAMGTRAAWKDLAARLECDHEGTSLNRLELTLKRGDTALGAIRAKGTLDPDTLEGDLNVDLSRMDHDALNRLSGADGFTFASGSIQSTNRLMLREGAGRVDLQGNFRVANGRLSIGEPASPVWDLDADYDFSIDIKAGMAEIKRLTINGAQERVPVLEARLTRPMGVNWGAESNQLGDAQLSVAFTNLDLAHLKAFSGDIDPGGTLNGTLTIDSRQSGKQLDLAVDSRIEQATARLGARQLNDASLALTASGQLTSFKALDLTSGRLVVEHAESQALNLKAAGLIDLKTLDLNVTLQADAWLAPWLVVMPEPGVTASSGTLQATTQWKRHLRSGSFQGQLALKDFSGQVQDFAFANYQIDNQWDIRRKGDEWNVVKAHSELISADRPGGTITASGLLNPVENQGQLDLVFDELNEHALHPLLESWFGGKSLVSVQLAGTNTLRLDPAQGRHWTTRMRMENLQVESDGKPISDKPLSADFKLSGRLLKDTLELKDSVLDLGRTTQAMNKIHLNGQLDIRNTNAWKGDFKLFASTLDLTPYYNLFSDDRTNTSPTTPPVAGLAAEPEAMMLPIKEVRLDCNVTRLFLRNLELHQISLRSRLTTNVLDIETLQASISNRTMMAKLKLDVGVPGFSYEGECRLDGVPLRPLTTSFFPNAKGDYDGNLFLDSRFQGRGITESSLINNTVGYVNLSFTNANFQIVGRVKQLLLDPLSVLFRLQEISRSPLHWGLLHMNVDKGLLTISRSAVLGKAFSASSQGQIRLVTPWKNSVLPNLPIHIALRRDLADKSNLIPAGTPPESPYVLLPDFITLSGPLGDYNVNRKDGIILGLMGKSAIGLPGAVGSEAGHLIEEIGKTLSGEIGGENRLPHDGPIVNILKLPGKAVKKTGEVVQDGSHLIGGKKREKEPKQTP